MGKTIYDTSGADIVDGDCSNDVVEICGNSKCYRYGKAINSDYTALTLDYSRFDDCLKNIEEEMEAVILRDSGEERDIKGRIDVTVTKINTKTYLKPLFPTIIDLPDPDINPTLNKNNREPKLFGFDLDKMEYNNPQSVVNMDYIPFCLDVRSNQRFSNDEKLELIKKAVEIEDMYMVPVARIIQFGLWGAGKDIPTFRTIFEHGVNYDDMKDFLAEHLLDYFETIKTNRVRAKELGEELQVRIKEMRFNTTDNMLGHMAALSPQFKHFVPAEKRPRATRPTCPHRNEIFRKLYTAKKKFVEPASTKDDNKRASYKIEHDKPRLGNLRRCREKWLSMAPPSDASLYEDEIKFTVFAKNEFMRWIPDIRKFQLPLARIVQFEFRDQKRTVPSARTIYSTWKYEYLIGNVVWPLLDYLHLIIYDYFNAKSIACQLEIHAEMYGIRRCHEEREFAHLEAEENDHTGQIHKKSFHEILGQVPLQFRTAMIRIIQIYHDKQKRLILSLESLRKDGLYMEEADEALLKELDDYYQLVKKDTAQAELFGRILEVEAKKRNISQYDKTDGFINLGKVKLDYANSDVVCSKNNSSKPDITTKASDVIHSSGPAGSENKRTCIKSNTDQLSSQGLTSSVPLKKPRRAH